MALSLSFSWTLTRKEKVIASALLDISLEDTKARLLALLTEIEYH